MCQYQSVGQTVSQSVSSDVDPHQLDADQDMRVFHDFGWFATRIREAKMMRIRPDPDPHHCQ